MPTATEIATIMFDDQTAPQISCSNSDGQKRIAQMAADVTDQVVEETQPANVLALLGWMYGNFKYNSTGDVYLSVTRSSSCGTYFIL